MNSFGLTNEEIRPEEINLNHLTYLGRVRLRKFLLSLLLK